MTDAATAPVRPRTAAPASAVAATTGAAFDEVIALTGRLRLPHIRRAMTEVLPIAKAERREPAEVGRWAFSYRGSHSDVEASPWIRWDPYTTSKDAARRLCGHPCACGASGWWVDR